VHPAPARPGETFGVCLDLTSRAPHARRRSPYRLLRHVRRYNKLRRCAFPNAFLVAVPSVDRVASTCLSYVKIPRASTGSGMSQAGRQAGSATMDKVGGGHGGNAARVFETRAGAA
jgi:hypothetical protein